MPARIFAFIGGLTALLALGGCAVYTPAPRPVAVAPGAVYVEPAPVYYGGPPVYYGPYYRHSYPHHYRRY